MLLELQNALRKLWRSKAAAILEVAVLSVLSRCIEVDQQHLCPVKYDIHRLDVLQRAKYM